MLPWDTGQLKRGDSLSKCGLSRMSKTILGSPYQTHSIIDPKTLFQVLRPPHSGILDCLGWGLTDRQGWQSFLAVTFVVGHGCCLAGEGWFVFRVLGFGCGFSVFAITSTGSRRFGGGREDARELRRVLAMRWLR